MIGYDLTLFKGKGMFKNDHQLYEDRRKNQAKHTNRKDQIYISNEINTVINKCLFPPKNQKKLFFCVPLF